MDIKILKKNVKDSKCTNKVIGKNLILEEVESGKEVTGVIKLKYVLFDTESNIRKEILPEIKKYSLGIIKNLSFKSDFLYFFTYDLNDDGKYQIRMMRYNYISGLYESVFAFEDDLSMYLNSKRLKIFVLNEAYMIVQHEYRKSNRIGTYSGFFEFKSFLYNNNNQKFYSIADKNISDNGIDDIMLISETHCAIKTGVSLLEDNRFGILSENEVHVEGIYFANISQIIADMLIMQKSVSMDEIDRAFYTSTFPYIDVIGKYFVYSKINNIKREEEVIFYDLKTKMITNCINKNVEKPDDLTKKFIIGNEPYIAVKKDTGYEFVDLKKAKRAFKFDKNLHLENVVSDVFIFTGTSEKGLLRKEYNYIEIFGYPQQNTILREKGDLVDIKNYEDNLYIFTSVKNHIDI